MRNIRTFFSLIIFAVANQGRAGTFAPTNSSQGLTISGFVATTTGTPVASDTATATVTISASDGTNNCTVYLGHLTNIAINNGDFNLVLNSGTLSGTYTSLSQVLDSSNAAITGTSCTGSGTTVNGTQATWQVNVTNLNGTTSYIGSTALIIPITGVPFAHAAQVALVAQNANAIGGISVDMVSTVPSSGNVLGYNGSKWAPTSGITGSGTANYLSKFTASTTLASSSLIYDNGTGIGIGTTAPSHPLEVDSSDVAIYGVSSSGGQYTGSIYGYNSAGGAGVRAESVGGTGLVAVSNGAAGVTAINYGSGPGVISGSSSGPSGIFQSGNATNTAATLVTQVTGSSTADLFQAQNSSGAALVKITSAGRLGIGVSNPTTPLQVNGEISPSADAVSSLGDSTHRFLNVYASNGTILTSDAREKKNVQSSDLGLDFINHLRPVSYLWKSGKDKTLHYGLIAQETEKVISETRKNELDKSIPIVDHDAKSDKYGIRYTELISPLIKAAQEISARISELAGQAQQQSNDMSALKTAVADANARASQAEKELTDLKIYLCSKDPQAVLCKQH